MFEVGSPFHLYMMEEDGHSKKVEYAGQLFKDYKDMGYDINSESLQDAVFMEAGLSSYTPDDIERIRDIIQGW